ncbi:MAG TPA: hypothetical protein VGC50_08565 [Gammaproteobacteria bacterium]
MAASRRQFASSIRQQLARPLSLLGFFAAGLLLGPPRLVAASGRPSIGSFLAMVVAAKRIIDTFHHIGLVTEQLPSRTASRCSRPSPLKVRTSDTGDDLAIA